MKVIIVDNSSMIWGNGCDYDGDNGGYGYNCDWGGEGMVTIAVCCLLWLYWIL